MKYLNIFASLEEELLFFETVGMPVYALATCTCQVVLAKYVAARRIPPRPKKQNRHSLSTAKHQRWLRVCRHRSRDVAIIASPHKTTQEMMRYVALNHYGPQYTLQEHAL